MRPNTLCYIDGVPIRNNFINKLPFNPHLKRRAKALRKAGHYDEVIFWQQVHKRKFYDLDFDRQRIIGNYITDFYCKTLGLIIEIDGGSHNDKEEYDTVRDQYFELLHLRIYHISATDIQNDIEKVLRELAAFIITEFGGD